mmetsp:Transcript_28123/g.81299  ORF Transcript_28123/g.81299 Transcript_28123/m.81299 type:complete len:176 (-) Transcript_28123:728-1255(-)
MRQRSQRSLQVNLMLLMDGNEEEDPLCACIDKGEVGETVRLCDCVKYDYDSGKSKRQQWIMSTSSYREQQWRPRRASHLCVCPDHGTLRLFECSDNQQALWVYVEEDDGHMRTFRSGDVCASPNASRELGIGFGTRGQGGGGGRYDATGDDYSSACSTSLASRADPLVLMPRSRS